MKCCGTKAFIRNGSLVDDSVLGELSEDVVEIGRVRISVGVSVSVGGLVVDVVPGDAVVRPGRRGNANLRGPDQNLKFCG